MSENQNQDVQKRLFECIQRRIPKDELLVSHVAAALERSEDVAYSRINGRSQLLMQESFTLMQHFSVAPDEICEMLTDRVSFAYSNLDMENIESYKKYIDRLTKIVEGFAKEENCKMFFLADEIPIFHFMPHLELIYFKLYTWMVDTQKSELDSNLCYEDFVEKMNELDLQASFAKLYEAYLQISSVEVWSHCTIDGILQSIEEQQSFLAFSSKESVNILFDQVTQIWNRHKEWGGQGKKPSGAMFDFYCVRTPFGAGKMYLECDAYSRSVIKLHTINSMATESETFNREIKAHVKGVLDRSTLIGASGRDTRIKFVRMVEEKIERAGERLRSFE